MPVLRLEAPRLNILGLLEGIDFSSQLREREIDNQLTLAQARNVNSQTAFNVGSLDSRLRSSVAAATTDESAASVSLDLANQSVTQGLNDISLQNQAIEQGDIQTDAARENLSLLQDFGRQRTIAEIAADNARAQASLGSAASGFGSSRRSNAATTNQEIINNALNVLNNPNATQEQIDRANRVLGRNQQAQNQAGSILDTNLGGSAQLDQGQLLQVPNNDLVAPARRTN